MTAILQFDNRACWDGRAGGVCLEDIIEEIERLKRERNAVILAHLYQPEEIQEIADFTGDSFGLSRKAAQTDAVFVAYVNTPAAQTSSCSITWHRSSCAKLLQSSITAPSLKHPVASMKQRWQLLPLQKAMSSRSVRSRIA